MNKYKSLIVNSFLFLLNTVSTKLITFILIPLYTYFLSTEEYGVTDMSLTVASLATPLVTLSIGDAVTRYIIDDPKDTKRYASIGFWITLFGCVISGLFLPVLDISIFGGLGKYKFYYFIYFVFAAFNSYLTNVARGLNQIRLIAFVSIASSFLTAGAASFLIGLAHMKIDGYFISLTVGSALSVLFYLFVGKSYIYINLFINNKDYILLKRMLLYSIPLIPNSVFWWAGNSINRFFITGILGIGASGLFAAASKIPNVMNMISSTFWQAWSLSAFQEYRTKDVSRFYTNVFTIFRLLCFIAASLLIFLAPWLASFLLQKDFYNAWPIIPILIIAFLFNVFAGFYGTVFTAGMKTKYLMTTTFFAALAVVIATWILVPVFGLEGAATAMVVSNLIMYVTRVQKSKEMMKIRIHWPLMRI